MSARVVAAAPLYWLTCQLRLVILIHLYRPVGSQPLGSLASIQPSLPVYPVIPVGTRPLDPVFILLLPSLAQSNFATSISLRSTGSRSGGNGGDAGGRAATARPSVVFLAPAGAKSMSSSSGMGRGSRNAGRAAAGANIRRQNHSSE